MPGNKRNGTWKFFLRLLLPVPVATIKLPANAGHIALSDAGSIAFFLIPPGKTGLCGELTIDLVAQRLFAVRFLWMFMEVDGLDAYKTAQRRVAVLLKSAA
jgi:hypothetical protein